MWQTQALSCILSSQASHEEALLSFPFHRLGDPQSQNTTKTCIAALLMNGFARVS